MGEDYSCYFAYVGESYTYISKCNHSGFKQKEHFTWHSPKPSSAKVSRFQIL